MAVGWSAMSGSGPQRGEELGGSDKPPVVGNYYRFAADHVGGRQAESVQGAQVHLGEILKRPDGMSKVAVALKQPKAPLPQFDGALQLAQVGVRDTKVEQCECLTMPLA